MGLKFWKKEEPKVEVLVGASMKHEIAAKMREQERMKKMGDDSYDAEGQYFSQTLPITIGFVIAVIVALLGLEGSSIDFSSVELTGIRSFDDLVFGNGIPSLFGDKDIDKVLILFIRGALYCSIAGLVPVLGRAITKMASSGKINHYVACWLVVVSAPLIYVLIHELFSMF